MTVIPKVRGALQDLNKEEPSDSIWKQHGEWANTSGDGDDGNIPDNDGLDRISAWRQGEKGEWIWEMQSWEQQYLGVGRGRSPDDTWVS